MELTSTPLELNLCISLPVSGSQMVENEEFFGDPISHTSALAVLTLKVGILLWATVPIAYNAYKRTVVASFADFIAWSAIRPFSKGSGSHGHVDNADFITGR